MPCSESPSAAIARISPPLEIRQPRRGASVAAVGRSENREQRRVLRDGQQLAVAKRPAPRREIAAEHDDLTDERFHECSPASVIRQPGVAAEETPPRPPPAISHVGWQPDAQLRMLGQVGAQVLGPVSALAGVACFDQLEHRIVQLEIRPRLAFELAETRAKAEGMLRSLLP